MKMYLLTWTTTNFPPTYHLYETYAKAKEGLDKCIGEYIRDCVEDGDIDAAVNFIKNFKNTDENGIYGEEDEIWIEELDVEK